MEDTTFDGFTRAMSHVVSRRGAGALAAGVASWFGMRHESEAKRKKKHKKQKCNRCGAACCAAGEVCVVRGTAGEQCVPEIRTCTAAYGPGSACVLPGPGCTQTGCTRGFCKAACPV